ncbi:MAG: hypothetical protein COU29_01815 [Candidatus Magasanikbacteria bacterium CG10_big_fil_rev_8_21_14_0_10_36_32]|uniref:Uncharacterized protein n=1 Tax=Candidatus Magasanikbacteria bacterium CG10_big_fil_rev_8_21_14_0_10_36_32 TaxID=1974646 RepID=A0A2M6W6S3_9BACT|nr:MAG: hypothetical protein COU29_01815 [Candidatus Magasanikbacteria bacterium CG10_big_fil_rev_8_21_14_0_10_36_32]
MDFFHRFVRWCNDDDFKAGMTTFMILVVGWFVTFVIAVVVALVSHKHDIYPAILTCGFLASIVVVVLYMVMIVVIWKHSRR